MFEGIEWAGTRSTIVTRNEDHISFSLRHTGGDSPNAGLADQFHVHAGARIRALEVENQLL